MTENFVSSAFEKRETEPFGDFVVFTTTLYKGDNEVTKARKELALRSFDRASSLGVDVVVIDGGSDTDFLERLKRYRNVKVNAEPAGVSMGEGRRFGLREAMKNFGKSYFLWMEPEKEGLLEVENLQVLLRLLREDEFDIVVPKRKKTAMDGLTKEQRWFERRANLRASRMMKSLGSSGKDDVEGFKEEVLDLWFGPKAFNRRGAEAFLDYKATNESGDRWDAIIVPVANAIRKGLRVGSVEVDFAYDKSQTQSEKGNRTMFKKRLDQYRAILQEMGDTSHL